MIKIKFVDYWDTFEYEKDIIWITLVNLGLDPVISDEPDYVFYNVFGNQHLLYNDCVKIFYTCENLAPDFNLCDYAVGFEMLDFGDRYFRHPYYCAHKYKEKNVLCENKHINPIETFSQKKDFCAFVYSNSGADIFRTNLFNAISSYKKVNSGGRYMNNIGMPEGVPDKIEFMLQHKFSIACENSSHIGYTTEKLLESFAAKTVPIYWGNPCIKEEFNEKAFINVSDFSSLEDLVERIRYLDTHDEEYLKILSEPAFSDESKLKDNIDAKLAEFLFHIFNQPKEQAFRRNRVFWGEFYQINQKKILDAEKFYAEKSFLESIVAKEAKKVYKLKNKVLNRKID